MSELHPANRRALCTLRPVRSSRSTVAVWTGSALGLLLAAPIAWGHAPASPDAPRVTPVPRAAPAAPAAPAPRAAPRPPAAPCPTISIDGQAVSGRERGYLGVEPTALSPELRRHFGVDEDAGVLVAQITPGSAAERGGLRVGDIVTRVEIPGERPVSIDTPWRLGTAIADRAGESLDIEVWREGSPLRLAVVPDARERCAFDLAHVLPHLLEDGVDIDIDLEDFERQFEAGALGGMSPEALHELSRKAAEEAMRALEAVDWEQQAEALRQLEDLEIRELELEGLEEHMERLEIEMERLQERLEGAHEERLEAFEDDYEARLEAFEEAREAQLEAAEQAMEARREAIESRQEAYAERHEAAMEAEIERFEARVEAEQARREAQLEAEEVRREIEQEAARERRQNL